MNNQSILWTRNITIHVYNSSFNKRIPSYDIIQVEVQSNATPEIFSGPAGFTSSTLYSPPRIRITYSNEELSRLILPEQTLGRFDIQRFVKFDMCIRNEDTESNVELKGCFVKHYDIMIDPCDHRVIATIEINCDYGSPILSDTELIFRELEQ